MLSGFTIITVSLAYLSILFAIAYYGDRRADAGRSIIASPYIYALSVAVYCTAGPSTAAWGSPRPRASASFRSIMARR